MRRYGFAVVVGVLFIVGGLSVATPLDDYVAKPDASYRYEVVKTVSNELATVYVIDMISQTWRTKEEVDRPQWRHWLTIVQPKAAESGSDTALLYINGGSNKASGPESADLTLTMMAVHTKTVIADLKTVPNQPLNFPDGGRPRSEDAIIAYTFDKYIATGDANWPALLPMVKSAVRAMDTVQKHLGNLKSGALNIEKFVVAGASKRGWTTWLTAAVDKRVVAICPAVIDVLNMGVQMKHHHAAYGFWAPAIHDYEEMKVFDRLDIPEGQVLRSFIDPYAYRERYTMPKLLLNSAGDQFFLPDSAQFYFADLPGPKYLRYFPNTGHGLDITAYTAVTLFLQAVLDGGELPKFTWEVRDDGAILVKCETEPIEVRLWSVTNPDNRDFRLETVGSQWTSKVIGAEPDGTYVGEAPDPEKGWTAYFVELTFNIGRPMAFKLTTEVRVIPDTLPFAEEK